MTINIPLLEYEELKERVLSQEIVIEELRLEIKLLKKGSSSNTSSTPSSQDYTYKSNINLREKTNKKSGGQSGHK